MIKPCPLIWSVNKALRKGSECQFFKNMRGASPVCMCAGQEADNTHFQLLGTRWNSNPVTLLQKGNWPLEENISGKIYKPEQCSGQVQSPSKRMQLPLKASIAFASLGPLSWRLTAQHGEPRLRGIIKMTKMRLSTCLQTRQSCLCLETLTALLAPGSRVYFRHSDWGL